MVDVHRPFDVQAGLLELLACLDNVGEHATQLHRRVLSVHNSTHFRVRPEHTRKRVTALRQNADNLFASAVPRNLDVEIQCLLQNSLVVVDLLRRVAALCEL